jgi:alpha-tubulin suppressor-like RCC1 family protein
LYGTTLAIRGSGGSGSIWGWGSNDNGQIGNGTTASFSSPVLVDSASQWSKITAGGMFSFGIKTNRTLWAWGDNGVGQLGIRSTIDRSVPTQVGALTDWVKVVANGSSAIGMRANGTLWGWGSNNGKIGTTIPGTLGIGNNIIVSSPVQVGTATDWADVELCEMDFHPSVIARKTNGTVWVWGVNDYGVLLRPFNILPYFKQVGSLTTWTDVDAGGAYGENSFALGQTGSLWAWGSNIDGSLGINVANSVLRNSPVRVGSLTGWTQISSGGNHTLALRSNNTLWAWGSNENGQLGDGTVIKRSSPVQIGTDTNWSIVSSSTDDSSSTLDGHSAAIKTNGTLWTWGRNGDGQLGNGLTINSSIPVQVGSGTTGPWIRVACSVQSTIGIRQDGTLWSWGDNDDGVLGRGQFVSRSSSPIQVGTLTGWTEISCGNDHVLAKRWDGTLWAWGRNRYGQIGRGNTTNAYSPVQIGTDTDWSDFDASTNSSFATKTSGTIWGWGYNKFSVIDSSSASKSIPIQIETDSNWSKVSCGRRHLIATKTNGTLWARGKSDTGGCGVGYFNPLVPELTGPTQISGPTASSLMRLGGGEVFSRGFLRRVT